jgi:hypothetical protein
MEIDENTRFSKELNLHYYIKLDGSIHFEDGVIYSAVDVFQLKYLKSKVRADKHTEFANAVHRLKKFFNVDIGLIMPLN